MRISDWSSDVCSSDLIAELRGGSSPHAAPLAAHRAGARGRDGRAQFRTAPTFHAAPFGKKRTDVRLDHHVQFEVRHRTGRDDRSEEHTSELQSLMRISYAVLCLTQKKNYKHINI